MQRHALPGVCVRALCVRVCVQHLVGEVSDLLAEEGSQAAALHHLDSALMNINAWSGAEMRACLNRLLPSSLFALVVWL